MAVEAAGTAAGAVAGGAAAATPGVLRALQAFLAAQRQRAEQYHMLDAAHRAYCASGAEGPYRYAMGKATEAFTACSQAVLAAEATLRRCGRQDLAALLGEVQQAERRRLDLALSLQVALGAPPLPRKTRPDAVLDTCSVVCGVLHSCACL